MKRSGRVFLYIFLFARYSIDSQPILERCSNGLPELVLCFKLKSAQILEEVVKTREPIPLLGQYIFLTHENDDLDGSTDKNNEFARNNDSEDLNEKGGNVDKFLISCVQKILETKNIRLNLDKFAESDQNELDNNIIREEGRKKDKDKGGKKKGGIMMMMMAGGAMMMHMMCAKVALLAGKALIIAKLALILAGGSLLKNMMGGAKEEMTEPPPKVIWAKPAEMSDHGGGGGWHRSMDSKEPQHRSMPDEYAKLSHGMAYVAHEHKSHSPSKSMDKHGHGR